MNPEKKMQARIRTGLRLFGVLTLAVVGLKSLINWQAESAYTDCIARTAGRVTAPDNATRNRIGIRVAIGQPNLKGREYDERVAKVFDLAQQKWERDQQYCRVGVYNRAVTQ